MIYDPITSRLALCGLAAIIHRSQKLTYCKTKHQLSTTSDLFAGAEAGPPFRVEAIRDESDKRKQAIRGVVE
ncbi:hypothetical protein L596_027128 [Steinernema carpocapsae]|uniref:Uncharacterized protein n=1 Tax=Steinernema carpocapsae TaxID=34508 RepID=A0A4U5M3F8_STECR|nr:hypothetical protein L596_027128 [Steinernema carpocapsae]